MSNLLPPPLVCDIPPPVCDSPPPIDFDNDDDDDDDRINDIDFEGDEDEQPNVRMVKKDEAASLPPSPLRQDNRDSITETIPFDYNNHQSDDSKISSNFDNANNLMKNLHNKETSQFTSKEFNETIVGNNCSQQSPSPKTEHPLDAVQKGILHHQRFTENNYEPEAESPPLFASATTSKPNDSVTSDEEGFIEDLNDDCLYNDSASLPSLKLDPINDHFIFDDVDFNLKDVKHGRDNSLIDGDSHSQSSNFDDKIDGIDEIIGNKNDALEEKYEANYFVDANNFSADFSQFESDSQANNIVNCSNSELNNMHEDEHEFIAESSKSNLDELYEDDFEDYQDFRTFNVIEKSTEDECISTKIEPNNSSINIDDFGEFSNNVIINQPIIIPILQADRIPSLLDLIFPALSHDAVSSPNYLCYERETINNSSLTESIQDFDNSKAFTHHWQLSIGKTKLVTALGIDPRNILHGSKWNNSIPRFAANLDFSPLQPLKSDSIKTNDGRPKSSSNSILEKQIDTNRTTVPAVQFDWNSSGLVNPLDATHAHTLLLDLEQLLVVAKIDKIKLDSSATCFQSSSDQSTGLNSSKIDIIDVIDMDLFNSTTFSSTLATNSIKNSDNDYRSFFYSTNNDIDSLQIDPLTTTLNDTTNNAISLFTASNATNTNLTNNLMGLVDQYLDCRVQEIIRKTGTTENRPTELESDRRNNISQSANESKKSIATENKNSMVNNRIPDLVNHFEKNGINDDKFCKRNHNDELPTSTSSSYVIPGSGTLKETHIFTPIKNSLNISQMTIQSDGGKKQLNKSQSSNIPDFDFEKASAGIIINENVVKKEYRDLEYNPSPRTAEMFEELGNEISKPANIIDGIETMIDEMNFSTVSSQPTNELDLPEQHSKSTIIITPTDPIYSSIEDGLANGIANEIDDEFTDFQSVPPVTLENINPLPDVIVQPKTKFTNSISDVIPDIWQNTQPATLLLFRPSLLMPVSSNSVSQESIKPHIDWPDPGINPDEMARLEAIFATPKYSFNQPDMSKSISQKSKENQKETKHGEQIEQISQHKANNENEEWTDFVSNSPTTIDQPIVSPIHQQILKDQKHQLWQQNQLADDDDWSEFISVSVSAPTQSLPSIRNVQSDWNQLTGPNFTSWNTPSANFNSWQSPVAYTQQPDYTISSLRSQLHTDLVPNNVSTITSMNHLNSSFQNKNYRLSSTASTTNIQLNSSFVGKHSDNILPKSGTTMRNGNLSIHQNLTNKRKPPNVSIIPDMGFMAPSPKPLPSIGRSNALYSQKK